MLAFWIGFWLVVGAIKTKKENIFLILLKMTRIKNKSNFKQKRKSKEDKKHKDVIDQLTYRAPKLIEKAPNKIDQFVKWRIDQIMSEGNQNNDRLQSKIIWTTIEPFKMLGKFGEKQYKKSKRNLKRHLERQ